MCVLDYRHSLRSGQCLCHGDVNKPPLAKCRDIMEGLMDDVGKMDGGVECLVCTELSRSCWEEKRLTGENLRSGI